MPAFQLGLKPVRRIAGDVCLFGAGVALLLGLSLPPLPLLLRCRGGLRRVRQFILRRRAHRRLALHMCPVAEPNRVLPEDLADERWGAVGAPRGLRHCISGVRSALLLVCQARVAGEGGREH